MNTKAEITSFELIDQTPIPFNPFDSTPFISANGGISVDSGKELLARRSVHTKDMHLINSGYNVGRKITLMKIHFGSSMTVSPVNGDYTISKARLNNTGTIIGYIEVTNNKGEKIRFFPRNTKQNPNKLTHETSWYRYEGSEQVFHKLVLAESTSGVELLTKGQVDILLPLEETK